MPATERDPIPLPQSRQPLLDYGKLSLEWRRLKNRLRLLRKWWLRPHRPFQPLLVIATWRSGSNLLLSYLNQQPGVSVLSEVLCSRLPIGPRRDCIPAAQALKHIRYSLQGEKSSVRGCKLMLQQLGHCQLTLNDLHAAIPNAKYVILYRQSLAEQFVSQKLAVTTRQFLLRPGEKRKQAEVVIDPSELRAYCDDVRRRYHDALSCPWLAGRAVLVSYEELTNDADGWLSQHICPLLGVPFVAPQTRLCKQSTQPLAEQIANYREVAALLHSPLCKQFHHAPWQCDARQRAA